MANLLVGLANPWPFPKQARHNLGSLVLESLCDQLSLKWEWWWSCFGWVAKAAEPHELMMFIPATFYNVSGLAIRRACTQLGFEPNKLIILHDDIDLDRFCWASRWGGSDGGNRGVRSIFQFLDAGVRRLRIGVGRPASRDPSTVAAHVLGPVEPELLERWQTAVRSGELLKILGLDPSSSRDDQAPSRGMLA